MTPRTMSAEDEHTGRQVSPRAYAELDAERAVSADLLAALSELMRACTPPSIPADGGRVYGVRMPEREVVDRARAAIARATGAR